MGETMANPVEHISVCYRALMYKDKGDSLWTGEMHIKTKEYGTFRGFKSGLVLPITASKSSLEAAIASPDDDTECLAMEFKARELNPVEFNGNDSSGIGYLSQTDCQFLEYSIQHISEDYWPRFFRGMKNWRSNSFNTSNRSLNDFFSLGLIDRVTESTYWRYGASQKIFGSRSIPIPLDGISAKIRRCNERGPSIRRVKRRPGKISNYKLTASDETQ